MDKPFENTITIYFPIKGISRLGSYTIESIPPTGVIGKDKVPVLNSPYMLNVRAKGPEEERARGGQRAGLTKWSVTQIGGSYPVINLTVITTTYITPA